MNSRSLAGLKWRPRKGVYTSASGNLVYNPSAKVAHSYDWYVPAKEINGVMVLNTYRYSVTTAKHVYKMIQLFEERGVNYITLEAPRGLQDLDCALSHTLGEYAKLLVANKYARKPVDTTDLLFQLAFLHDTGHKYTKQQLAEAIKSAEADRVVKLNQERQKRLIQRAKSGDFPAGRWARKQRVQGQESNHGN